MDEKFDYNNILNEKKIKIYSKTSYNEAEVIEKYKNGEYRIVTEQARYPLDKMEEIFSNYVLQPEYQRRRVWDTKKKSKLIESFIINVPIPPIFLYEYEYSEYEVMDGLQRITTILSFLKNDFRLEGLELWEELNGKQYDELPDEIKAGINRRYVSAIILLKETASTSDKEMWMKKFVFERLNTGGMTLSPQEIRNALYSGELNTRIISMAEMGLFKEMWGLMDENYIRRMEDCELVLRFLAYKSAIENNITKSTAKVLDNYSELTTDLDSSNVDTLEKLFKSTVQASHHLFGINAFKSNIKNKNSEKMIYDTIMLSVAKFMEKNPEIDIFKFENNILEEKKYEIIEKYKESDFNGKYTALSVVRKRVEIFEKFLEKNLNG
ncbi:DUF262 domain-containing protein [Lactococcus lactis]|uniref:DUF262 domain-containing protein n=1 Tax=Lactococcus lactis TaxID=1358 RepID=UPI002856902D|nr:DUF262 domain-containing protein [Lactococcus lactis]MDR7696297.1 DUF262 domain-containing protein [Lactococcus lactis]